MTSFVRRAFSGILGLMAVAMMATLVTAAPAGAAVGSTTAHPAAHPTWSNGLTWPVVGRGARGERVFAIQYLLQNKGYHRLRADGVFGRGTAKDVRSFQRNHGLNPSGNVGASTWNRLIITVKRGTRGSAVRAVQHNLKYAYGFRYVRVNGIYTRETRAAVTDFQRSSRLAVTGIVGHRTWKTIIVFER
jgi:peptidoglycan hydrolase-like protein with peptidoglycan-binding domain